MESRCLIASSVPEYIIYRLAWNIGQFKEIIERKDPDLTSPNFVLPCCSENSCSFSIKCKLEKKISEDECNFCIDWIYTDRNNTLGKHFLQDHGFARSFHSSYYPRGPEGLEETGDPSRYWIKVKVGDIDSLTDDNGVLKVQLDIRVMRIVERDGTLPKPSHPLGSLVAGMSELLKNNSSSDLEIQTSDTTLKVHKLILAMRSPVFKAMFESDMKESRENSLKLDYVDTSVVSNFIHYIYTDELEAEDFTILIELVRLADQYQIDALKNFCCNKLLDHLNSSNLLAILELVYTYEIVELRMAAMEFVRVNKSLIKEEDLIRLMVKTPRMCGDIFKQLVL